MASVIIRHGHSIDGQGTINYDDRPSSYDAADQLAGRRLDRRRNYAIIDGAVHEAFQWSQACSGCYEGHEIGSGVGMGCSECGYTGRRRNGAWAPLLKQNNPRPEGE